jgi:hypothetical protein
VLPVRTARDAVDHLLLGAPDLDSGIAWLEARIGVRAVPGGSHPGWGTRNALVSLGLGQYLEIIAPDPAQSTWGFPIDVRQLESPRLLTWAASTDDPAALVAAAAANGVAMGAPRPGSRARPDGSLLTWTTVWATPDGADAADAEPMPFFIAWDPAARHPSLDAPHGCHLLTFDLRDRRPDDLSRRLATLGIEVPVAEDLSPGLIVTLDTPRGRVTI